MKRIFQITDADFVYTVRMACQMFAVRWYKRTHPGSSEQEAHAYARRYWRQFLETSLDWLAMCEALAEAEDAAPWN